MPMEMEERENVILQIFFAEKARQLASSKIYNEGRKRGVSSTTLYRWLDQLTQKEILRKEQISRKNILYYLNIDALPKGMAIIFKLQNLALQEINAKMSVIRQAKNFDEVSYFKQLIDWIGALTLYSAYEAVLNGRLEYMEIPAYYIIYIAGAFSYVRNAMRRIVTLKAMQERPLTSDELITLDGIESNHSIPWDELHSRTDVSKEYYDQAKENIEEVFNCLDSKVFKDGKIETIRKLFEETKKK